MRLASLLGPKYFGKKEQHNVARQLGRKSNQPNPFLDLPLLLTDNATKKGVVRPPNALGRGGRRVARPRR